MASALMRRRFDRQPPTSAADPGRDSSVFWSAAGHLAAGGKQAGPSTMVDGGSDTFEAGPFGLARKVNVSSGGVTVPKLFTGTKFIAWIAFECVANLGDNLLLGAKRYWSNNEGWRITSSNSNTLSVNGGDGGSFPTITKTGIFAAGSKGVLAVEFNGTAVTAWFNGERIGTATLGSVPGAADWGLGIGSNATGAGSDAPNGLRIYAAGVVPLWADAKQISISPWFLAEPRRIPLPVTVVVVSSGNMVAVESGSDTATFTGGPLSAGTLVAVESGSDAAALVGVAIAAGTLVAVESGSDTANFFGGIVITSTGTLAAIESGSDAANFDGAAPVSAAALAVWQYVLPNGQRAEDAFVESFQKVSELHLIHGLKAGAPLTITPTSRSAGAVEQSIANDGSTTTVQRV